MQHIVSSLPISTESATQIESIVTQPTCLADYGCKVFSQNGEDGIIYYIFSKIGVTNRKCIEISGGDGIECNSANLMLNHGFRGLIFEANSEWIEKGIQYYEKEGKLDRIQFMQGWITKENIVGILSSAPEFLGPIDLLTMDIDGVDYWILKEIMEANIIQPRVIIVEYQDILGPDREWTVPYHPMFHCQKYDCWQGPNFCGASLKAFMNLLAPHYVFVGCEGLGFNGFFLHRDELGKGIEEMKDIAPCFDIEKVKFGMKYRFPRSQHLPWVDLSAQSLQS